MGSLPWRQPVHHQSFCVIKRRHVVVANGAQLFIAQASFSAHGRIDVYSEGTADARRGAYFCQLNITQGEKPFAAETGFHGDAAPNESWHPHLHHRGSKIFQNILRIAP